MNQVWIELEQPKDEVQGKKICDAANRMLARLTKPEDIENMSRFFWNESQKQFQIRNQIGCKCLPECGEWFNLDYLGRH